MLKNKVASAFFCHLLNSWLSFSRGNSHEKLGHISHDSNRNHVTCTGLVFTGCGNPKEYSKDWGADAEKPHRQNISHIDILFTVQPFHSQVSILQFTHHPFL